MATRGTALLLMDSQVLMSTEFNGDMYESGHGDSFFKSLSKVQNEDEFDMFLSKFNEENFQYREELIYRCSNESIYNDSDKGLIINFELEYFQRFSSDWLFIKNLTGDTVTFNVREHEEYENIYTEIKVKHGETARFNYGRINPESKYLIEAK